MSIESILTVISPATTINLTTRNTVKEEMNITTDDDDAKIDRWITQASRAIADYCGRQFGTETVSEQFRFCGAVGKLILRRWPVQNVSSVEGYSDVVYPDEYEVDYETGFLWKKSDITRIAWSDPPITVVYTAGYELLTTLPESLERACINMVKQYRSSATRDPLIKSVDVYMVQRTDYWVGGVPGTNSALSPEVIDLVAPYRSIEV